MQSVEDEEKAPPGTRTRCHRCHGDGWVPRPTMVAFSDGTAGTMTRGVPCPDCERTGWLPGTVIPV